MPASAAPDEGSLGSEDGYPKAPTMRQAFQERYRVGSFSAMDAIMSSCSMPPSAKPLELPHAESNMSLSYAFQGKRYTLDDYMQRQRATAVLVLHDGAIVAEHYSYDRTPEMRMLSNSMSKTVNALGLMKALEEGLIRSLDDTAAAYVPELKDTLYGETRLVNLMRMASGAKFTENYSGADDRAKFGKLAFTQGYVAAVKSITERADLEGDRFNYNSSQTTVLGLVLRAATHRTVCDYIGEKIWAPMGAEATATWLLNPADKTEVAQGGLNATVRDYARLGLLLAEDGRADGHQIISVEHLRDMTDAARQPLQFRPGIMVYNGSTYDGYGLQTWLVPGSHRRFALYGIYGQAIFVDPDLHLVMVHMAVAKDASGDASGTHMGRERDALFRGIVASYGQW